MVCGVLYACLLVHYLAMNRVYVACVALAFGLQVAGLQVFARVVQSGCGWGEALGLSK